MKPASLFLTAVFPFLPALSAGAGDGRMAAGPDATSTAALLVTLVVPERVVVSGFRPLSLTYEAGDGRWRGRTEGCLAASLGGRYSVALSPSGGEPEAPGRTISWNGQPLAGDSPLPGGGSGGDCDRPAVVEVALEVPAGAAAPGRPRPVVLLVAAE